MNIIYYPIKGNGTIKNPFQIEKVENFRQISYLFASCKKPLYFEMINDIDFKDKKCYFEEKNMFKYEQSLCMEKQYPFTGCFDGKGHTLKNATFFNNENTKKNGIFNYCNDSLIRNLDIENVTIIGDYNLGILASVFVNSKLIKVNFYNCSVIEKNYIRNIIEPASIGGVVGKSINSEFSIIKYDININSMHENIGNFIGNIDCNSNMIDCNDLNIKTRQKIKKQDN